MELRKQRSRESLLLNEKTLPEQIQSTAPMIPNPILVRICLIPLSALFLHRCCHLTSHKNVKQVNQIKSKQSFATLGY